jgi:hypothetical protein
MVTIRLTWMFSGLSIPDQPADGEFVDVGADAGFFQALGQAVHAARKDRTERAAEQIDARLRRGRSH